MTTATHEHEPNAQAPPTNTDASAKDPVCGMVVNRATALHSEIGSRTYYFCSPGCQRDPPEPLLGLRLQQRGASDRGVRAPEPDHRRAAMALSSLSVILDSATLKQLRLGEAPGTG